MSNYAGKQTRSQIASDLAMPVQQSVGKRTLVEQVQQRAGGEGEASRESSIQDAAARGVATPSSALPNSDAIQRSFGRHDVSGIQAHTGGEAAASAKSMGAEGFATSNHVVLAKPDLFTEAHEAAHVVQQRGGVQLKGGVGQVGDSYEQHADQVAELVVQGKSAESLLDSYAGNSASGGATTGAGGAGGPTQLKLSIGGADVKSGVDQTDVEATWARIGADPRLAEIQEPARALLTEWITKAASYDDAKEVSQNRHYPNDELLIRALVGDVGAQGNLEKEGALASQCLDEGTVNALLATALQKLAEFHKGNKEQFAKSSSKKGRYAGWSYEDSSLASVLEKDPGDLHGRISFIADYALTMRRDIAAATGLWDFRMSAELSEGRHNHHNTNEDSDWIKDARTAQAPVSAGPSATTAQVLALSVTVGCSKEEREALAWALFALWNIMPLHKSGTHRFHEVMAVAMLYDVSYEKFQYCEPPKKS